MIAPSFSESRTDPPVLYFLGLSSKEMRYKYSPGQVFPALKGSQVTLGADRGNL